MEAGDKFATEAREILLPETTQPTLMDRFDIRGKKLVFIICGIILVSIFVVYGKI